MNDKLYTVIRAILTAVAGVGMLIAVALDEVIIGLVVFGACFAILQILRVKYKKEIGQKQR